MILSDETALANFENKDAESAWKIVRDDSPELESKLLKSIGNCTKALQDARLSEIEAVKSGDKARLRELKKLDEALKIIVQQAGKKL